MNLRKKWHSWTLISLLLMGFTFMFLFIPFNNTKITLATQYNIQSSDPFLGKTYDFHNVKASSQEEAFSAKSIHLDTPTEKSESINEDLHNLNLTVVYNTVNLSGAPDFTQDLINESLDPPNNILRKEHHKIPILLYHHFSLDPNEWNGVTVSPLKFREEMLYLKALGYTTIHFSEYLAYRDHGTELPDNPIIITIDDGYLSNYQYAFPILKELDMKATISVIGWSVGRELHKDNITPIIPHFTWDQAREMYESGLIDIQAHTYDLHELGDTLYYGKGISKMSHETETAYRNRFATDTLIMKQLIEAELGNKVNVFVYPYGISNTISEEIIKRVGFKFSMTTDENISNLYENPYLLSRINMPSYISSVKLIERILKYQEQDIIIPFQDIEDPLIRMEKLEELIGLK